MNNILKRDGLTFSHSTDYGAIRLKENIEIYIQTHPQAKVLKDKLLLEFQEPGKEPNIFYTNIVGNKVRTSREINSPSDRINVWVESIVRNIYHSGNTEPITYDTNSWFAEYHHGNFAKIHHHYPFALFSFVYFINCPKGSSPLVFTTSGRKIKAEEGKVVIFPSMLKHHVPDNKCESRITLAGNLFPQRVREEKKYGY